MEHKMHSIVTYLSTLNKLLYDDMYGVLDFHYNNMTLLQPRNPIPNPRKPPLIHASPFYYVIVP